jgi:neurotransmitter:Na+ symporter, NSS family
MPLACRTEKPARNAEDATNAIAHVGKQKAGDLNKVREQWASQTGFILATVGSAVGLGNIWRFAYVTGENGGAVFLLVYLTFVASIGVPLVMAELALGRRTKADAVTAIELGKPGNRWRYAGWLPVAGCVYILSYYSIIAGWALKYFFGAATGTLWDQAEDGYGSFFESFIAQPLQPLFWQALMLAGGVVVVSAGVVKGIERLNLWLMPLLALIVIALAGFALTLPGSGAGLSFLFAPDMSHFGRPQLYISALGQAFFSIGVGMAIFITYGGYMTDRQPIPASAVLIAGGDALFAIVAGIAIFPAVFALGGDPAAGPRLAFITLPQIFLEMPGGRIIAPAFFFLLCAAALTSIVSLLEVPVAALIERLAVPRRQATVLIGCLSLVFGIPSALGYGLLSDWQIVGLPILDAVDYFGSNALLPIAGLLVALSVGWRLSGREAVLDAGLTGLLGQIWWWAMKVVVPAAILLILVTSIASI